MTDEIDEAVHAAILSIADDWDTRAWRGRAGGLAPIRGAEWLRRRAALFRSADAERDALSAVIDKALATVDEATRSRVFDGGATLAAEVRSVLAAGSAPVGETPGELELPAVAPTSVGPSAVSSNSAARTLDPLKAAAWRKLIEPYLSGQQDDQEWALIDNSDADDLRYALEAAILELRAAPGTPGPRV